MTSNRMVYGWSEAARQGAVSSPHGLERGLVVLGWYRVDRKNTARWPTDLKEPVSSRAGTID